MVLQKLIKNLKHSALVRSRRGNTYKAVFKDKNMSILENVEDVDVEFINNTPVIISYYLPPKEKSLEEQEKEFLELGGNY